MIQARLYREVAAATGETVSEISRRGFGMLAPLPKEPDPEDLILDWDQVELERNVSLIEQRQSRTVA